MNKNTKTIRTLGLQKCSQLQFEYKKKGYRIVKRCHYVGRHSYMNDYYEFSYHLKEVK